MNATEQPLKIWHNHLGTWFEDPVHHYAVGPFTDADATRKEYAKAYPMTEQLPEEAIL